MAKRKIVHWKPKKFLIGIYRISCVINKKVYIGSSINIERRIGNHKSALKHKKHKNLHLQRAFNKYGEGQFIFEIVEICVKNILLSKELEWFKKTNCCIDGFNICERPSAGVTKTGSEHFNYGRKHTGESLRNIINGIRNRPDGWRDKIYVKTRGLKESEEIRRKRSLFCARRKLTPKQVHEIRQLIGKMRNIDIAKKFNVAPCTISNIKHGRINKLI